MDNLILLIVILIISVIALIYITKNQSSSKLLKS